MNRAFKYGLVAVILILLGYNSIYIEKLSNVKNPMSGKFNSSAFAEKMWTEKLPAKLDSAIDINTLRALVKTDANSAFNRYTHALDIGNYRYTLIKGEGTVEAVNEDDVTITIKAEHPFEAILTTEFVYGNTLRDASGLIDLRDFPNTSDLNDISKALNEIIRQKVVPSFKPYLKPGVKIDFVGAIELNKEHIHFKDLEIVPARIKILP